MAKDVSTNELREILGLEKVCTIEDLLHDKIDPQWKIKNLKEYEQIVFEKMQHLSDEEIKPLERLEKHFTRNRLYGFYKFFHPFKSADEPVRKTGGVIVEPTKNGFDNVYYSSTNKEILENDNVRYMNHFFKHFRNIVFGTAFLVFVIPGIMGKIPAIVVLTVTPIGLLLLGLTNPLKVNRK